METAELDFEAPALKLERHVAKLCRTQDDLQIDLQAEIDDLRAVSYTHLTLPTILRV